RDSVAPPLGLIQLFLGILMGVSASDPSSPGFHDHENKLLGRPRPDQYYCSIASYMVLARGSAGSKRNRAFFLGSGACPEADLYVGSRLAPPRHHPRPVHGGLLLVVKVADESD